MLERGDLASIGLEGLKDVEKDASLWGYVVRMTSGTTGGKPILIARHIPTDPELILPSRRMIVAGGTLGFRATVALMFFHAHKNSAMSASVMAVGMRETSGDPPSLIEEYDPDFIHGVVSFILTLFSRLTKTAFPSLRKITWGGEYVSGESLGALEKKAPHVHIESWYGCAELGDMALPQCLYRSRFEFHPVRGVSVGVHEPDEKGEGLLLFTRNLTRSVSVRDYCPRDIGSLDTTPCPCGAPLTFSVRGRAQFDVVRVAGAIFHVEECERVMKKLAPYVADYQVVVSERVLDNVPHGQVLLRIVPTKELLHRDSWHSFIAEVFEGSLFITPNRTLGDLIADGTFLPLKVEAVSAFSWGPKKVRLKRETT